MAHLVTLTDATSNQEILFNLDMVGSVENESEGTVITTRWGIKRVKESLDCIMLKAKGEDKKVADYFAG